VNINCTSEEYGLIGFAIKPEGSASSVPSLSLLSVG
jgi:hypothetical protein